MKFIDFLRTKTTEEISETWAKKLTKVMYMDDPFVVLDREIFDGCGDCEHQEYFDDMFYCEESKTIKDETICPYQKERIERLKNLITKWLETEIKEEES